MLLRLTSLIALLFWVSPARAEELLPPRNEAILLLRVLAYDRTLVQHTGEAFIIGVAWQTGDEPQRDAALDALREAASQYLVASCTSEPSRYGGKLGSSAPAYVRPAPASCWWLARSRRKQRR